MRSIVVTGLLALLPLQVQAREAIHVVGSSTVFPFVAAAAEHFGRKTEFRTPVVESTGTGGGLQMFCSGAGENTPDMANASRTIKPAEIELCKQNGVSEIAEIKIGYDGIVFVTARAAADFPLTKRSIFLALAREVPVRGALVQNPYQRWSDIDPALPELPIRVYGPPPTSGTRDAFAELVMEESCKALPEFVAAYPDGDTRKRQCQAIREDGAYIDAGENDNLIVQKLANDTQTLAIFGYSFLEENALTVKAHPVDGVMPEFEAITSGKYHVARAMYVYVKNAHLDKVAGLRAFLQELVGDEAMGEDGYLILKGLLPLPPEELRATQRNAVDLKTL